MTIIKTFMQLLRIAVLSALQWENPKQRAISKEQCLMWRILCATLIIWNQNNLWKKSVSVLFNHVLEHSIFYLHPCYGGQIPKPYRFYIFGTFQVCIQEFQFKFCQLLWKIFWQMPCWSLSCKVGCGIKLECPILRIFKPLKIVCCDRCRNCIYLEQHLLLN